MHQREIDGFMKALAPVIGGFVAKAIEPLRAENARLLEEVAALKQAHDALPKAVDEETIARLVDERVAKIPPALPGKDADLETVAALVDKAVAAIELPVPDMALIAHMIGQKVEAVVAELPPAEPGKSVTVEDVRPLLVELVAALPPAEPGKSVTVEDLAPLVVSEVGKAVVAAMPIKDPVGLAGALIDREGELVITLSDGATKALGRVVGRDGADIDMDAVHERIASEVKALPKPRDGVDGVGFDDMDLVDVEGDLFLRFTRGDVVKDFYLPVPTDRGVWAEREFRKGAGVTWGGSFWLAQRDTSAKPDTPDSGWRLSVKRGRDGASAFDVARKAGFRGTEREWLDSLRPGPAKPVKVG